MAVSDSYLTTHQKYACRDTAQLIKDNIDPSLRQALTEFTASDLYVEVERIKVIVKHLQGYSQF